MDQLASMICYNVEYLTALIAMDVHVNVGGDILLATMQVKPSLKDKIREAQDKDKYFQKMKTKVQEGKNNQFIIQDDGMLLNGKRVCVPNVEELRTEIMHEAHYAPYAMHPGSTKMYRDLKPYYWWPTMKKDVTEFVARCLTCQQVKAEHQAHAEIPDLLLIYGSLQRTLGTKLHFSTAFHPQTDGQSERTIQTLEDMMRAYVIEFRRKWDDHLPLMEFAYTNSFHTNIGVAPYEALYGRKCRSLICWDIEGLRQLEGPELVQERVDKIQTVKKCLKAAQDRHKSSTDKHCREMEYEVGEIFFLKVSPWTGIFRLSKQEKLSPRYIGPYEILERVAPLAYRDRDLEGLDICGEANRNFGLEYKEIDKKEITMVKITWSHHSPIGVQGEPRRLASSRAGSYSSSARARARVLS
ncbi:UNVERIFIED_CONTAM: Transposon Tf2-11 polyprotein [Sesamum angustifolium]|uniref:Transposon Tf2-11 polyprotein n=1 Tax=Sesamum angustifolium TaxID=2727405 RepID=A0AAW2NVR0_9LAMI